MHTLDIQMATLTGNEKRKASCKQVGGAKKRRGHKVEGILNQQFGQPTDALTYKAEADCSLCMTNPATQALWSQLETTLKIDPSDPTRLSASVKSGNNLQFTLGVIPEITEAADKLAVMNTKLKKSESAKPAGLLVYLDAETKSWIFFKMDDVVNYIVEKSMWRLLETGRMKGDFATSTGKKQILTYEYRDTHGSHFLGANGGQGRNFIRFLETNLPHLQVPVTIPLEDK
jgi:hypothetical protein